MRGSKRGSVERRLEELERENRLLRDRLDRALKQNESLKQEIERLRRQLEEALRAAHRQAAPHSRGEPKADPKRPGRKAGQAYGQRSCRPIPPRIDEQIPVPAPQQCLRCGGAMRLERVEPQYQEEIVRLTVVRRFDVEVGRCRRCGRRVQGRHPLQTSDALGAAQVQLGPTAQILDLVPNDRSP